jgi:hypothetical protein
MWVAVHSADDGSEQWVWTRAGLDEGATAVGATTSGGFLVAGFVAGAEDQDLWIGEFEAAGGLLWDQTYDRVRDPTNDNWPAKDAGVDLVLQEDGSPLVLGRTLLEDPEIESDIQLSVAWLVRIVDPDGGLEMLWGSDVDGVLAGHVLGDGANGLIVAGHQPLGATGREGWIRRLDETGQETWAASIKYSDHYTYAPVIAVTASGEVFWGTSANETNMYDQLEAFVGTLSSDGSPIWDLPFEYCHGNGIFSVALSQAGTPLVVQGHFELDQWNASGQALRSLDSSGTSEWFEPLPKTGDAPQISEVHVGAEGMFVVGQIGESDTSDYYVARINP